MKFLAAIPRILLGLIFTVFGLNGFFHFLPMPPMSGDPATFMGVIFTTGYYKVIFATQVVGGLLLLLGQFVPLGLVLLGPILVNILTFHITMAGGHGLLPGGVSTLLWLVVFWQRRSAFTYLWLRTE